MLNTEAIRREVISGDWTAINNRSCTLTEQGLRHNGNGLVWLHSGEAVHKSESDKGFSGAEKVSFEYHSPLCSDKSLKNDDESGFVQCQHIDSYCQNIIFSCSGYREFSHRKDGKPLATIAVQIEPGQRKAAPGKWVLYRNPHQQDKYSLLHLKYHAGLIKEYERQGWTCEPLSYVAGIIRNNAEFGRLMVRLGYVQVRTRKITGQLETFWLYRSSGRELSEALPLRTQDPSPRKASWPVVQTMTKPHPWFERVALDGKWQNVYADHIRFLTKKRHRVEGIRVQGYTAGGLKVEVIV